MILCLKKSLFGFIIVLITLVASAPLHASEILKQFTTGSLPLKNKAIKLDDAAQEGMLVIKGDVFGQENSEIFLRIDDAPSSSYANRYNEEWTLPPGPFQLRIRLKGLKAKTNRPLITESIQKFYLFGKHNADKIRINHFAIEPIKRLPDGAAGYSFGKHDSPLFEGFTRVTSIDPGVSGKQLEEILRPGVDPLIASGMNGIERITIKAKPGPNRVTFWTEETSAWQDLRGYGQKRITINGMHVSNQKYTPESWLKERYFKGRNREAGYDNDIWKLYGSNRGGRLSYTVDVGLDGELIIDLAGFGHTSFYLSAILVEPGDVNALSEIEHRREMWFKNKWKVDPNLKDSVTPDSSIGLDEKQALEPIDIVLTQTSGTSVHLALTSKIQRVAPTLNIEWENTELYSSINTLFWSGQRRLEKVTTGGNLFAPRTNYFRSDMGRFPIYGDIPRRYALWLEPKKRLPIGIHKGTVVVASEGRLFRQPLNLIVPPIKLPQAKQNAGFYLRNAPHLMIHPTFKEMVVQQNVCDLKFLKRLNIAGNAPALTTPIDLDTDLFIRDTQNALQFANASPWLAYHASFELYNRLGVEKAAAAMATAMAALQKNNLPAPIWSMADEPSNASSSSNTTANWVAAARKAAPNALLAGHLNNKADHNFKHLFDIAIINPGFGINENDIKSLKKQNIRPWIYNTGEPRVTAGLWLWLTGAERYLQWHGRLPLGDPFDPTDGREGDVSMFPPMEEVCAPQPDIHLHVLEMADGLVDQRLFQWLSTQESSQAVKMEKIIRQAFKGQWQNATGLTRKQLKSLRIAIAKLALHLNNNNGN